MRHRWLNSPECFRIQGQLLRKHSFWGNTPPVCTRPLLRLCVLCAGAMQSIFAGDRLKSRVHVIFTAIASG